VDCPLGERSIPLKYEEAQERIGPLGRSAGKKKEAPREEKAQEGRGLGVGVNSQPEERTIAERKALK